MEPKCYGQFHRRNKKQYLSESVFMGLCREIGTPTVVNMRRNIADIIETLSNKSDMNFCYMESGSYRGFRMEGSDVDVMLWPRCDLVIWDVSQAEHHCPSNLSYFLADCSESPPGFALLKILIHGPNKCKCLLNSCIRINDRVCISSLLRRKFRSLENGRDIKIHGPCTSINRGGMEFDVAQCFVSNIWPPPASSWISKCQYWPSSNIVQDIVDEGCHFVAIGHKLGNLEDIEWRISFSSAEQKIVHSMNHCQFLTYGLLKLFLKKVVNTIPGENKLLCSYHVKTAVFWTLQNHSIPCLFPQNFLEGFWVCFKVILKWVYDGYCPNFFIPENNMFLTRIVGAAQRKLFSRLNALYEKGLTCLFENSSMRSHIMHFFYNPYLAVFIDVNALISGDEFDKQVFHEVSIYDTNQNADFPCSTRVLQSIEQFMSLPLKECQILLLQKVTVSILQKIAFLMYSRYGNFLSHFVSSNEPNRANRMVYIVDRMSFNMLKFVARFGNISDMLFLAMYNYKTCRYLEALSILKTTNERLAKPYTIHTFSEVSEMYVEVSRGHSWTMKMRKFLSRRVRLFNKITYINELMLEQYYSYRNHVAALRIPPWVLLYMLEFLCYKHIDMVSSQAALNNLQDIVHNNQEHNDIRDISFQILGICHQISGNYQAALNAYQQSLSVDPYNKIQPATRIRILDVIANS